MPVVDDPLTLDRVKDLLLIWVRPYLQPGERDRHAIPMASPRRLSQRVV
jgi:hypothetical protein